MFKPILKTMEVRRLFQLLLVALLTTLHAHQVWSSLEPKVELSELIQRGIANHPELKMKENRLRLSEIARSSSLRKLYLPETTATLRGLDYDPWRGSLFQRGERSFQDWKYSLGVTLNYTISTGFKDLSEYQADQIATLKEERMFRIELDEYALKCLTALLDYWVELNQLQVVNEDLDRSTRIVEASKKQYESGVIPLSEWKRAQIDHLEVKMNLSSQKQEILKQVETLREILGSAEKVSLPVEDMAQVHDELRQFLEELTEKRHEDFSELPDIQLKRLAVEESQKRVRSAKGGYFPTITLSTGYEHLYTESFSLQSGSETDNVYIGATITIPLFGALDTHSDVQQSQIGLSNSQEDLRKTELETTSRLQRVRLSLLQNFERFSTAKDQYEMRKSIFNTSFHRFSRGLVSLQDALLDKEEVNKTFLKLVTAGRLLREDYYTYHRILGKKFY